MSQTIFSFVSVSGRSPKFRVDVTRDGQPIVAGYVKKIYVKHIGMHAWEATTIDGRHMACHEHRWQAAYALKSDAYGDGIPQFPVHSNYKKEVDG
jgi:hypothetical protein